jgi:hypothetical protein
MPLVAGKQVVSTRGVGTLHELVVVRVTRHLKRTLWRDAIGTPINELYELLAESLADLQLRACEHFPILSKNRLRNVEPGRFGNR